MQVDVVPERTGAGQAERRVTDAGSGGPQSHEAAGVAAIIASVATVTAARARASIVALEAVVHGLALDFGVAVDSCAHGRAIVQLDDQDVVFERLHGPDVLSRSGLTRRDALMTHAVLAEVLDAIPVGMMVLDTVPVTVTVLMVLARQGRCR